MADFAWMSVRNDQVRPEGDAIGVSGDLTFYNGGRELFSFPARWRDSLQVWQTGMDTSPIPDRLDIRATRTREMDCGLIYDGENAAHGFNTEGTLWPWWQKPQWALRPGAYRVRLRIAGDNVDPMEAWFDLTVGPTGGMRFTDRR